MNWIIIIVVLIVAACVGVLPLLIKKMRRVRGEVDAAKAEFLQKVGYEYASVLTGGASPNREKDTPQGKFTHHFEIYNEGKGQVTAQSWHLAPARPPPVNFQLVDKKLVGKMRSLLNLVGPVKRTLTVVYPGPHAMGDAELDARFALYATDAASACAVVREPEVRKALLELASVSMIVDATGATFGDPIDANVYASGASRTDLSPVPAIHSATRVHLAVEELLKQVVGAKP